jgi:hypothetical protein
MLRALIARMSRAVGKRLQETDNHALVCGCIVRVYVMVVAAQENMPAGCAVVAETFSQRLAPALMMYLQLGDALPISRQQCPSTC